MPDVPKDPRQLARDILAGKISIEDLAREQARRRGGQMPAPARPMNLPAAAQQVKVAAPPIRPIQTVRAAPPFPSARRPAPMPPSRPPVVPVRQQIRQPLTPSVRTARPAPTVARTAAKPVTPSPPQPVRIGAMLRQPANLRRAIVLSEILGPPVGFRDPK